MSLLKSRLDSLTPEVLAVFDCALEGIMIADANCVVCYINPAYTRMTGRRPEEEIGRLLTPDPPFGPLRQAITTGRPIYGCRYRPPGSKAELIVNASPLIVDGEVRGGVSFCQDISDILLLTERLHQSNRLVESLTEKLEGLCGARYTFDDIVGKAPELRRAVETAKKAAASSSTVLLLGETGTGKELFAHAIHQASPRRRQPFIKVNCAAIPENLLESELFGYEKGAFTGATSRKMGLFERADGGTIFLDEIGDMSLALQAKILRVLQDGEVTRLGGWRPTRVDVRIIAATNRNLPQMIKEGRFRADLYYRLNVITITIPPLRERRQDIPLLAAHLIRQLGRKLGKQVAGLDEEAERKLLAYSWPGNVRELANVLERAINLTDRPLISSSLLFLPEAPPGGGIKAETTPIKAFGEQTIPSLAEQERLLIQRALRVYGTSVRGKRQAAQALGISLATLYKKLKALDDQAR